MKTLFGIPKALAPAALAVCVTISAPRALPAGMDEKAHKHEEAKKEVTLEGEVLDLYCYIKHPDTGQGAEHVKCAKSCIRKGLPIGYLSGGEVYLILGRDHESASNLVVEYAGVPSRLTGVLFELGGVKSIELLKIEPVKPAK